MVRCESPASGPRAEGRWAGHGRGRAPAAVLTEPHRPDGQGAEVLQPIALVLPAFLVQSLREVAPVIEQPDADQGQIESARGLQMIPREDAQATGVDGQAAAQAVLHAEVGDAQVVPLRIPEAEPAPLPHVAAQIVERPVQMGEERRILGRPLQSFSRDAAQQQNGVVSAFLEQLRIEMLEHPEGARIPGPAQVERQLDQPTQAWGDIWMDAELMDLSHKEPLAVGGPGPRHLRRAFPAGKDDQLHLTGLSHSAPGRLGCPRTRSSPPGPGRDVYSPST